MTSFQAIIAARFIRLSLASALRLATIPALISCLAPACGSRRDSEEPRAFRHPIPRLDRLHRLAVAFETEPDCRLEAASWDPRVTTAASATQFRPLQVGQWSQQTFDVDRWERDDTQGFDRLTALVHGRTGESWRLRNRAPEPRPGESPEDALVRSWRCVVDSTVKATGRLNRGDRVRLRAGPGSCSELEIVAGSASDTSYSAYSLVRWERVVPRLGQGDEAVVAWQLRPGDPRSSSSKTQLIVAQSEIERCFESVQADSSAPEAQVKALSEWARADSEGALARALRRRPPPSVGDPALALAFGVDLEACRRAPRLHPVCQLPAEYFVDTARPGRFAAQRLYRLRERFASDWRHWPQVLSNPYAGADIERGRVESWLRPAVQAATAASPRSDSPVPNSRLVVSAQFSAKDAKKLARRRMVPVRGAALTTPALDRARAKFERARAVLRSRLVLDAFETAHGGEGESQRIIGELAEVSRLESELERAGRGDPERTVDWVPTLTELQQRHGKLEVDIEIQDGELRWTYSAKRQFFVETRHRDAFAPLGIAAVEARPPTMAELRARASAELRLDIQRAAARERVRRWIEDNYELSQRRVQSLTRAVREFPATDRGAASIEALALTGARGASVVVDRLETREHVLGGAVAEYRLRLPTDAAERCFVITVASRDPDARVGAVLGRSKGDAGGAASGEWAPIALDRRGQASAGFMVCDLEAGRYPLFWSSSSPLPVHVAVLDVGETSLQDAMARARGEAAPVDPVAEEPVELVVARSTRTDLSSTGGRR